MSGYIQKRCKYLTLLTTEDYDPYMTLPSYLHSDFTCWLKSIEQAVNPIRLDSYCLEIFLDASKKGWGAACGTETASGSWSSDEAKMHHINYLELLWTKKSKI